MGYTKAQIKRAFLLFLDEALPNWKCPLIEKRGNYLCNRCDQCAFDQFIKRAKVGELPKIEKQNGGKQ